MNILAIENSSSVGSVTLLAGPEMVKTVQFESPRGRGSALFDALDQVVGDAPIARIVVGTGPGGYNGLRSAIAAAWGVGLSRNAELTGISSLLGFAADSYLAAGDARGGHFYFARVSGGAFEEEPVLLSPDKLAAKVNDFGDRPVFVPAPVSFLPQAQRAFPEAAVLGRLGGNYPASRQIPSPMYLKPPHITQPRTEDRRA